MIVEVLEVVMLSFRWYVLEVVMLSFRWYETPTFMSATYHV